MTKEKKYPVFKEESGIWQGHLEELQSLSDDEKKRIKGFTRIDGGEKLFDTLNADTFNGLRHLEFIDLSCCSLTSLHEDLFKGMKHLREINLGCNSIKELPPKIFDDLTSLTDLAFYHNRLLELPPKLLDKCGENLRYIQFSGNQLKEIPTGFLSSCDHLNRSTEIGPGEYKEKSYFYTPCFGFNDFTVEEPVQLSSKIKMIAVDPASGYTLFYIEGTRAGQTKYLSGCRNYATAVDALVHWDGVLEIPEGLEHSPSEYRRGRAEAFAKAIRNFERENQS